MEGYYIVKYRVNECPCDCGSCDNCCNENGFVCRYFSDMSKANAFEEKMFRNGTEETYIDFHCITREKMTDFFKSLYNFKNDEFVSDSGFLVKLNKNKLL